jgi:propionyl-CoA synthetase
MTFDSVYREWADDPTGFWEEQARRLDWDRLWDQALDGDDAPLYRWFPGGLVNASRNCLDAHIDRGHGESTALIFDSPVAGIKETYSYHRLHQEVVSFAGALHGLGLRLGDTVLLYMPATPETVVAMLACARLGLTHSVVITSLPLPVLRDRIEDARPEVVLTASGGFDGPEPTLYQPMLEAALAQTRHTPRACVVLQRPEAGPWTLRPGRDLDWTALVDGASPHTDAVPVPSSHPLYLLYTSGSTARPKAVVRDTGGYLTALRWAVENVFGARRGDVFWTDSHPGWVMGHSFTVYGALVSGCATVLHEGPAEAETFAGLIAEHGVNVLFTTPMTLRRVRPALPEPLDAPTLRAVFLASERVEPELMTWTRDHFGCPVVDNWWQTETGWPIASNCLGLGLLPVKPGSVARPLPGYGVEILDEEGEPLPAGEQGHVAVRLPLPPGCLQGLWRDDQRFVATYLQDFPGYYDTSDAGHLDADGYLWIAGRTDDIIKVGGDSLSGLDVEHVVSTHPDVERSAVVAAPHDFYTQVPVAFVQPRPGVPLDPLALARELRDLVKSHVGDWAQAHRYVFVDVLPFTASKKIQRSVLRDELATGVSPCWADLGVIADVNLPYLVHG